MQKILLNFYFSGLYRSSNSETAIPQASGAFAFGGKYFLCNFSLCCKTSFSIACSMESETSSSYTKKLHNSCLTTCIDMGLR